jgi:hypothetical protein
MPFRIPILERDFRRSRSKVIDRRQNPYSSTKTFGDRKRRSPNLSSAAMQRLKIHIRLQHPGIVHDDIGFPGKNIPSGVG